MRSSVKLRSIVLENKGNKGCRESHANCSDVIVHCNGYDTGSRNLEVRDVDVAADYSLGMEKESSVPVASIAKDNEGHRDGELIRDYDSENVDIIVHVTPNTTVNCIRTTTSEEARGGVVVKALRYKPEGREFDSRWCHWNFSVT